MNDSYGADAKTSDVSRSCSLFFSALLVYLILKAESCRLVSIFPWGIIAKHRCYSGFVSRDNIIGQVFDLDELG
ncbi:hypothetical protein Psal006b_03467 (plasmid) [Piscirickettsia salmonis]|uniref:Uncharacterized protein n=1 Tax=Piscirickettsia salmonis TaxID=1238 RepID=A0A6I5Y116_PISSA|nr:hypothetical protein [Piscirickettsia salmonis]ALB23136.1 hypothetical protein KU39_1956 [Piscirickettsia salmonis]ALT18498.1 hypothetical protein PSLF89_06445 [Piscirickettsia salmonis LF-89 = ATCC VR-1361]ALY03067.1 hypothetical protein AWE47_09605 [Piscirickettsia salmonis]AMA42625.1 hypothetical protein AWJ11_09805 [Piscirickettsia salmonis]AOS35095.1 hypothetical protein AVM72_06945 [Piscirickettsia salmonis]